MPKKTNLSLGFLLLYDWLPAIYELPAKEVKALLIALIERQREGTPLPTFKNKMTNSFARMIEPVIKRRLDGQAGGKKGHEVLNGGEAPTVVPCPKREEEREEKEITAKISLERRGEESPTAASPKEANFYGQIPVPMPPSPTEDILCDHFPAPRPLRLDSYLEGKKGAPPYDTALSYSERQALLEAGVPSAYITARVARAAEWASKTKKTPYSVLSEWWQQDKDDEKYRKKTPSLSDSSFDAEEVFTTMVAKTYQNEGSLPTS